MKSIQNLDVLTETIRNMLISQSELSPDRVLNSLSLTGTDLDKLLEDSIYTSITQNDTTLLFELSSVNVSNNNVSMESGDKYNSKYLACSPFTICGPNTIVGSFVIDYSITYYKMYQLHLILYGLSSSEVAMKLVARLRSEAVRHNLYADGLYVEDITDIQTFNEFKNNLMWLRNDITINIGIKSDISQILSDDIFAQVKINNIKEVN